jgi:hypothetical protein
MRRVGQMGVLVAVVLLSACGAGRPAAGDDRGAASVADSARACGAAIGAELFAARSTPRQLTGTLPAQVLREYAVLRRPRLDPLVRNERAFARRLAQQYTLGGYYPKYVRAVAGTAYLLVPGYAEHHPTPSACHGTAIGRREQRQARHAVELLYCILAARTRSEPGCEPFASLAASVAAFGTSFVLDEPMVVPVPDGVEALRVDYPEHAPLVLRASANGVVVRAPSAPPRRLARRYRELREALAAQPGSLAVIERWDRLVDEARPTEVQWLGAGGRVLRTIFRAQARALEEATEVGQTRAPIGG